MIRVLVATKHTQGERRNDFSHTTEGELVMFGMECDGESVDGGCGCRRALIGVDSRKATTTFLVAERDLTTDTYALAIAKSLREGGWGEDVEGWAREMATDLLRVATSAPVGMVLEKRGNKMQSRKAQPVLRPGREVVH